MKRDVLLCLASILPCACATMTRDAKLVSEAAMAPEAHKMLAGPYEMGYDVAGEIVGTATATQVLLLFSVGDDPDSFVMRFIPGNNPLVKNAAANAVEKADADGIYVTRVPWVQRSGAEGSSPSALRPGILWMPAVRGKGTSAAFWPYQTARLRA